MLSLQFSQLLFSAPPSIPSRSPSPFSKHSQLVQPQNGKVRRSGIELKVLSVYRSCIMASRDQSIHSPKASNQLFNAVKSEFYKNKNINQLEMQQIESLVREAEHTLLTLLTTGGVKGISQYQPKVNPNKRQLAQKQYESLLDAQQSKRSVNVRSFHQLFQKKNQESK